MILHFGFIRIYETSLKISKSLFAPHITTSSPLAQSVTNVTPKYLASTTSSTRDSALCKYSVQPHGHQTVACRCLSQHLIKSTNSKHHFKLLPKNSKRSVVTSLKIDAGFVKVTSAKILPLLCTASIHHTCHASGMYNILWHLAP